MEQPSVKHPWWGKMCIYVISCEYCFWILCWLEYYEWIFRSKFPMSSVMNVTSSLIGGLMTWVSSGLLFGQLSWQSLSWRPMSLERSWWDWPLLPNRRTSPTSARISLSRTHSSSHVPLIGDDLPILSWSWKLLVEFSFRFLFKVLFRFVLLISFNLLIFRLSTSILINNLFHLSPFKVYIHVFFKL